MGIVDKRKELNKCLRKSKNVFLMAHKDLDLDALGSCIGLSTILSQKKNR